MFDLQLVQMIRIVNGGKMNVTIIGGGIAGLTTAIALKKAGFNSTIFEAAPTIKPLGAGLGLGANAIKAFQKLGIADEIIVRGNVVPSFSIYDQEGRIITRTDNATLGKKYGINNFTIHRVALHEMLLSQVDKGSLHFNKRAIDFIYGHDGIMIKMEDGSRYKSDAVIVADGIHSRIRTILLPGSTPKYAGYTCWRAVIPNATLQLTETSETWGKHGRFGIVPLADNKIYWFACINAPGHDPVMKSFRVKDLQEHFKNYHAPIIDILFQTRDEDLLWNDIIDLDPVDKYAFGNMVLIGDAAHAATPNLGQGACQAIEDAVILADEWTKNTSIERAFRAFEQRRLKRTHYIIKTSRAIGRIAQMQNKVICASRNALFRILPSAVNERQLEKLYKVEL